MELRAAFLLAVVVSGCNGQTPATDAPAADAECESHFACDDWARPACLDGRCVPACWGQDAGTACNAGVSDFPPECCSASEHCCSYSFETEGCLPVDVPCPEACPGTNSFTYCSADRVCRWSSTSEVYCAEDCDGGTACDDRTCCDGTLICGIVGCLAPPDAGP